MARINWIRKNAAWCVCLFSGLFIILVLACVGQTGNSNPHLKQKSSESGNMRAGQTRISQPQDQHHPYESDEVLVKFKSGTDAGTIERIRAALNLKTIRKFSNPNLLLMKITDGSPVGAVIEQLKTYEAVIYAEPNYAVKVTQ